MALLETVREWNRKDIYGRDMEGEVYRTADIANGRRDSGGHGFCEALVLVLNGYTGKRK